MQFAAQGDARDTPDKDAVLLTVDRAKVCERERERDTCYHDEMIPQ